MTEEQKPFAAMTKDCTGCEHMSRDVANIEAIAAAGSEGPTEVIYLYDRPTRKWDDLDERGRSPGWSDPLKSPMADAIRNGKIEDLELELRNLFDQMEREIRCHRGTFCTEPSLTHQAGCICQGCGKPYLADMIVPDDVWAKIASDDEELLCSFCITERIVRKGIWTAVRASNVDAADPARQSHVVPQIDGGKRIKLNGPELWEIVFGIVDDVASEITDEQYSKIAEAINNAFIDPLPQPNMRRGGTTAGWAYEEIDWKFVKALCQAFSTRVGEGSYDQFMVPVQQRWLTGMKAALVDATAEVSPLVSPSPQSTERPE